MKDLPLHRFEPELIQLHQTSTIRQLRPPIYNHRSPSYHLSITPEISTSSTSSPDLFSLNHQNSPYFNNLHFACRIILLCVSGKIHGLGHQNPQKKSRRWALAWAWELRILVWQMGHWASGVGNGDIPWANDYGSFLFFASRKGHISFRKMAPFLC